jgi:hypothetical protein
MEKSYLILIFKTLLVAAIYSNVCAQQPVAKTNPMKVYMHYMPWFETPATIGKWGWHWTMNNKNPDIIDTKGQRQIASHYYPLIGPYASRDKDVIEYHMLLMKLSGVDGLLVNWYGIAGSNGDIVDLLKSSDSIISYTDDFGLKFSVVMEDRFSRSVSDVKANLAYLKNNYFQRPEFIRMGAANEPLVCIFGPITFQQPANWTDILPSAGENIEFLTLWNESGDAGSNADGEFAWVYQDNVKNHMTYLEEFYKNRAPTLKIVAGSAYPGFEDFYAEGNVSAGYFTIPPYYGSVLDATLTKAEQYKANMDMLQLVTFNDFGEGTMFEPTVETGFDYLKRLQIYTGVSYGENELRLVYRLFQLRKNYAGNPEIQTQLNQASLHLRNLEISDAALILNAIPLTTGIKEIISRENNSLEPVIYPNPYCNGTLNIGFEADIQLSTQLTIIDIFGKTVFTTRLEKGVSGYSIDNLILSQGFYQLILRNENTLKTGKFIVTEK